MSTKYRVRNLELIRENNILLDLVLAIYQHTCQRVDNHKYTHNEIPVYKVTQELLILKGKIKPEECELK